MENLIQLHDEDLEKSILGTLIDCNNQSIVREMRNNIVECAFYSAFNQDLYDKICDLNDRGESVNLITLNQEYRKTTENPPLYKLVEISDKQFVSTVELVPHIVILNQYKQRRQLWLVAQNMINASKTTGGDVNDLIATFTDQLHSILYHTEKEDVNMGDVLADIQIIVDRNKSDECNNGLVTKTGFSYLDKKGGLQASDLVILAGRTSQGKTAFALSMTRYIIEREGKKVAFFTMEMTNEQLVSRMLSGIAGIPSNDILTQKLENDSLDKYNAGLNKLYACRHNLIFSKKETFSLNDLCNTIRRMKANHDIDGAIIDYLQLVGGQAHGESREQFIGKVARTLKNLAKELNIWIVCLSQLHRMDKGNDPFPKMSELRDSGQIEEAADLIMLVHRPEYYNMTWGSNLMFPQPYSNEDVKNKALVVIGKGRRIGVGSFLSGFNSYTTTFYDLSNALDQEIYAQREYDNPGGGTPITTTASPASIENKVDLPF